MRSLNFSRARCLGPFLTSIFLAHSALAEPQHGVAMYGDPALPPDFVSLPYVNPDAPKGGRVVTGNVGGFDSLNPFQLTGNVPWQLRFFAYESLMGRSWDEPFTIYGLLAESVETGPDREWVEFTLRPEAQFSDGSPVTPEDVIWSFRTIGGEGHLRYRDLWSKVERIEQTGPRKVRLTFNAPERDLALLAGLRPIIKKAQWNDTPFTEGRIGDIPVGSAPYVIDSYEVNRNVVLRRNPAYWGQDLPLRRGTNNFDEIRIEFYGDNAVLKEAFKGGAISYVREFNAEKWETLYDFPAVQRGDIVKSEIPHQKPSGITGFVMNTRRAPLDDWRVRDALLHAFNFEFINDTLTGGRQPRITSYFSGSILGMRDGPAPDAVRALLAPYRDTLLPGAIEGYQLPQGDGTARNRANIRKALKLLREAGWTSQEGVMRNAAGDALELTVVLQQDGLIQQATSIMDIYDRALERLGIELTVESIDKAQYAERERTYDFDLTFIRRALSLSPGNEQYFYWGSAGVTNPGSRNLMGMNSPAAEAMIAKMLSAETREEFVTATRALDRVLISGRYVIPIHQYSVGRIAHVKELHYPSNRLPIYGDGVGFLPEVWWYEEEN